ncbi:MAG: radical SAM protein [Anaerolineae bacterium]|nr:radical SAM protein [Anaerolineae bacterium]
MDIREKLNLLAEAARYDDLCVSASDPIAEGRGLFAPERTAMPDTRALSCVSHVQAPDGQRKAVLKILQTSACQYNCNYCAFRAGRDVRRAHLTPDELARSFDLMYRAGLVEGLFLSSGVIGVHRTMDEMLATVELVRLKYGFRGYIHLKLLPGAQAAHVERAIALADRVSANLEAPTSQALAALAPLKSLPELVGPLQIAADIVRRGDTPGSLGFGQPQRAAPRIGHARLGLSTQFVVGPAGESDRELLTTAQMLYRKLGLARAYYSAFSPVPETPLAGVAPTDPMREFRLYQADWLLRYYGFDAGELPFGPDGLLPKALDPKAMWARLHPERFPVEVNRAPLSELLRVPGIGPASARAIVAARRQGQLRELGDLRKLGARADRAAPYITLAGKRPPHQPPLPL